MSEAQPSPIRAEQRERKREMRRRLRAARRRVGVAELGEGARAIADHLLDTPELRGAATVAAYVAVGSEPGTGPLLRGLSEAGVRVLLPCMLPDLDLDWAEYTGDDGLRPASHGLLEPEGRRLGVDAIAEADAVLVPGLAVSRAGVRLGQGGGCYDRALSRVPVGTFSCVLLHDGELGVDVPDEPHDRRVSAAVTPGGLIRF